MKELEAKFGRAGEGFEAARITMKGVLLFGAEPANAAIDKNPAELIEGAFGVQEALQPTLDELEQQNADIQRAPEEARKPKLNARNTKPRLA